MDHVSVSPTDGNGPTQGQRKTLIRVGIPRPSGQITAALPTEPQGQTRAGRANLRCQCHGNEYAQVQGRVTFLQTLALVTCTEL